MTARELEAQSLVDPLLVAHLDEDWAVPCEARKGANDCPNQAEWIAWHVVCCPQATRHRLWCMRHRDYFVHKLGVFRCRHCGWRVDPAQLAIRLIEPLTRRPT